MAQSRKVKDVVTDGSLAKYTISVAMVLTGVATYRIRRFEEFGLVKPVRTGGKQRLYSDIEIALIREIKNLESEGINLRGIKAILEMRRGERE